MWRDRRRRAGTVPALRAAGRGTPPAQRNPLLIPGIVFAVVAVLMIAAIIVYAATGGDQPADDPVAARTADPVATAAASETATGPSAGTSPSADPSPSASPSPSTDSCILGVWFEEQHNEKITVPNTGVFPVHGSGTYQRYSYDGVAYFDYGSGVRLSGTSGSTAYEFIYTGFIRYSYRVENGEVIYSNPRAQGTETLYRDGGQVYTGKLEARNIPSRKLNCGSVAMSLTSADVSIELKRTSARQ
ncbi:hypothetical protein GCM10027610_144010 [Dactylosporangium cerinum]